MWTLIQAQPAFLGVTGSIQWLLGNRKDCSGTMGKQAVEEGEQPGGHFREGTDSVSLHHPGKGSDQVPLLKRDTWIISSEELKTSLGH